MDAIKLYKISRKLYDKNQLKLASLFQKLNKWINNSYVPCRAKIGEGSSFAYGGIGVVIHSKTVIGKNCMIGQNITIGGRTGHGGVPRIGDNVYMAAGSRILGGIVIGDNVIIGANAVVLQDVPSNSIVVGIPAKIISRDLSKFKKAGVI